MVADRCAANHNRLKWPGASCPLPQREPKGARNRGPPSAPARRQGSQSTGSGWRKPFASWLPTWPQLDATAATSSGGSTHSKRKSPASSLPPRQRPVTNDPHTRVSRIRAGVSKRGAHRRAHEHALESMPGAVLVRAALFAQAEGAQASASNSRGRANKDGTGFASAEVLSRRGVDNQHPAARI